MSSKSPVIGMRALNLNGTVTIVDSWSALNQVDLTKYNVGDVFLSLLERKIYVVFIPKGAFNVSYFSNGYAEEKNCYEHHVEAKYFDAIKRDILLRKILP
jgi:hypothetical protein